MLDLIARYWWLIFLRGLLSVGFGIVALIWPDITILALVVVFGVYALFDGVLDLFMGASGRGSRAERLGGVDRIWFVWLGLVGIGAGIIAIAWPGITAVALLWVIAFWAVLSGLIQIITAMRLRAELTNEWMWVLAGLFSVALGVLLILQPATGALALVIWIGFFSMAWGVALMVLSFRVKGLASEAATTPV